MKTDFQYTITLYLVREGRPKYWEFHCFYCQTKVCDLDGKIIHGTDVVNSEVRGAGIRVPCRGTGRRWCRMWYEFFLS